MGSKSLALSFHVQAECKTSRARAGIMKLPHYEVKTPVFMPVGTQVSGSSMQGAWSPMCYCKLSLSFTKPLFFFL